MQVNSTLKELHLSKHGITDTGTEWLCRMLKENSSLTLLNLSWYDTRDHSMLTEFHVSFLHDCSNNLSRDGAQHLSGLLQLNTPLAHLDVSYNRIEDEGLQHISRGLSTNTNLTWLNVCHNSIGDKGLCALGGELKESNDSLTNVYIWGNKLGEPTCNVSLSAPCNGTSKFIYILSIV